MSKSLMSEGRTHFLNETICLDFRGLRDQHHFKLPDTIWSNGAAERLKEKLFRVFHFFLPELHMQFLKWPDLLPLVHSTLNNAPVAQRNMISPNKTFKRLSSFPLISNLYGLKHLLQWKLPELNESLWCTLSSCKNEWLNYIHFFEPLF